MIVKVQEAGTQHADEQDVGGQKVNDILQIVVCSLHRLRVMARSLEFVASNDELG